MEQPQTVVLDEATLASIRSAKTSDLIIMLDADILSETLEEATTSAEARKLAIRPLVEAVAAEIDRRIPVRGLLLTTDEAAKLKIAVGCGAGECQITDEDEVALDAAIDRLTSTQGPVPT